MSSPPEMMLILTAALIPRKYPCLLTTCRFQTNTVDKVMGHIWKFKANNGFHKTCTGQQTPSLSLCPSLFSEYQFHAFTGRTLAAEYPSIPWTDIQALMEPTPVVEELFRRYDFFVTQAAFARYATTKHIPDALSLFILPTAFDPSSLHTLLGRVQQHRQALECPSSEPPSKKRKLSLALPPLSAAIPGDDLAAISKRHHSESSRHRKHKHKRLDDDEPAQQPGCGRCFEAVVDSVSQ